LGNISATKKAGSHPRLSVLDLERSPGVRLLTAAADGSLRPRPGRGRDLDLALLGLHVHIRGVDIVLGQLAALGLHIDIRHVAFLGLTDTAGTARERHEQSQDEHQGLPGRLVQVHNLLLCLRFSKLCSLRFHLVILAKSLEH
jgi:hypothetical protein